MVTELIAVGLVGAIICASQVSFKMVRKAIENLSPEQVDLYLLGFKKQNQNLYTVITTILWVFFMAALFLDEKRIVTYVIIYSVSLIAAVWGTNIYNSNKFKKVSLPDKFIQKYTLAKTIDSVAWSAFFAFLGYMAVEGFNL